MAQVSFTIAAIDRTRAAFASINQGLNRLVKGGDAAQKSLLRMGLQAVGVASIFTLLGSQVRKAAQDIESIPGVSRDTVDSWEQLKAAAKAASDVIGSIVATSGHAVASLGRLTEFGWNVLIDGLDEAQKKVVDSERAMGILRDQGDIEARIAAIEKLGKARRELANIDETAGAGITRRRQEAAVLDEQASRISDVTKQTLKQADAAELRTAAEKDYNKLLAEHTKLTTDAGAANAAMMGATVPLQQRIEGLESAWARASHELSTYNDLSSPEILEKRNQVLADQKRIADQLTKAYDEQNRIAADAARVITGGFEDAIFAGEGLRGMIRGIGQDLMRYIFQQSVTKSLGGFIASGIGSLIGGGGGPQIDVSGLRAAGGPVSAGKNYIVGENGPELFTASQSGQIIPNGAMGGGGNTYIIDARGVDESVVSRLSAALMQLAGPGVVERRAISATSDRRSRMPAPA